MSGIQQELLGGPFGGQYQIERSLRFNSADSAYLNRTFGSAGNLQTWTWSAWIKRSGFVNDPQRLFYTGNSNNNETGIHFSANRLAFEYYVAPTNYYVVSSAVFRDPSAWYHFVVVSDTTNATSSDRMRIYVNGSRITNLALSSYPAQNANLTINSAAAHYIGRRSDGSNSFDGYFTEINFIDGQALTPSSFGQTNASTGVWEPIAYTGTYGTNGFYVNFSDNSGTTSTTLGKDYSGNGNNWTPNNFSVTAGVGNDSLVDTPTSYGTDTGAGGEVRGNYCTMNPLTVATLPTLANGNLDVSVSSTGVKIAQGTFQFPSSGKWYYECTFNNASSGVNGMFIGITSPTRSPNATRSTAGAYFFYAASSGLLNSNGTDIVTGLSTISANEVFKVAVDIDNSKVWIGRGSTWYNSSGGTTGDPAAGTNPTFSISATGLTPMAGFDASSVSLSMNFGQRTWAQTCPSGFKALCTTNLPTPTIGATSTTQANDYMNVVLYTGTGSSLGVTGVGFQPDFVWVKGRSGATDHGLYDAVRGVQKQLETNNTGAETTESTGLTAFGTDGFTVGALAQLNTNTATYVAWNWKANGAGSSNTDGTITSTVSANTTSGFSIVTYTGTGANATVGHGLGVAPKMVIVQKRSPAGGSWFTYHANANASPASGNLYLCYTNAFTSEPTLWNSTAPTSSVFSLGTYAGANGSTQTFVAYCWAAVAGYSAFGSYTGNGSADGPFVYLGFRPRFVLFKSINGTNKSWWIEDTARDPYNVVGNVLAPNLSDAEATGNANVDFVSNGFKLKSSWGGSNTSGETYIYAAFAETPFAYSLAR